MLAVSGLKECPGIIDYDVFLDQDLCCVTAETMTALSKLQGRLPMPPLSKKDMEEAQKILKAREDTKRMRSSMMHWLHSKGWKNEFDRLPMGMKKDYMKFWLY